jgi:uncharacterized protein
MDKVTKLKLTIITIVGVIVGFLYINRGQLVREFRFALREKEWRKEESKGQLRNGKKHGLWTTHYENGRLESSQSYFYDTLHGRQLVYYPSGQLYIKRTYLRGKEIDSTFWYHSNGQINVEEFRDSLGRKQGLYKIYYANGQPSQIAYCKNGEFDGESLSYFNNGQPWDIKKYKLGERVGTWIEFSKSGDTVKVERY